jgi:D-tyrosyl-tRNA(Tyr) deacylase
VAESIDMRAVVQRVSRASVRVDGDIVAAIGPGLLVLVGAGHHDTEVDVETMARKLVGLRIFRDEGGSMNHSVAEVGGSMLIVSQFTLYADVRKGRRPAFVAAARPEVAEPLVDSLVAAVASTGTPVATGRFGAMMEVELLNDGPVTIIIETREGAVV